MHFHQTHKEVKQELEIEIYILDLGNILSQQNSNFLDCFSKSRAYLQRHKMNIAYLSYDCQLNKFKLNYIPIWFKPYYQSDIYSSWRHNLILLNQISNPLVTHKMFFQTMLTFKKVEIQKTQTKQKLNMYPTAL